MRRCLIVANQTLEFERLAAAVQQRIDKEEHTFYVAVPATPLKDQATGVGVAGTEGASPQNLAYAVAQQRLDQAVDQIRANGAQADGEVGDPDALEVVRTALGPFDAQEVIVSTLPAGLSRWLRRDL